MTDVFESVGVEEGANASDQDSPMRLNGTSPSSAAVASRLYGTRSRRDSMGSEDMISFSDQDEGYNQPTMMMSLTKQMEEIAAKAQSGDDERSRLKMENGIMAERLHILEEQLMQTERRAEEQLEYERSRNKDMMARGEREKQLEAESAQLKYQILEKDLQHTRREAEKAKTDLNKVREELEKTKDQLEDTKMLLDDMEDERVKLEKQFKDYKKEAQQDIDSSSEMVEVLKEQTEELRRRAVPRQGSIADQMVALEEELERSRSEARMLQNERDDLQAQLLAASVERGTSLLADIPSLADELSSGGGDSSQLLEALREQEICNQKLRVYINGILSKVIMMHPEILEVGPSSSDHSS